jgi:hypothetical protein
LVAIHDQEDDRVWTELTWSPDTIKWHRVLPGTPLIPNTGEEGDYDWGCAYAAACPVFLDNEIRLYYGGSDGYHFGWRNGFFALATLRPDGFAGYTPIESGQWASVITVPMATDQGPLRLCADIEPGGRVKVTLLDATHEPLAHSIPLTQSMTDGRVTWQNGFSFDLLEKDVRLQIQFKEATVYSVSFSE